MEPGPLSCCLQALKQVVSDNYSVDYVGSRLLSSSDQTNLLSGPLPDGRTERMLVPGQHKLH